MKRLLLTVFLPILALSLWMPNNLYGQDDCECTNCPVPIQDNGTFQGFLDVVVDGPNDLSLCPLQQVCFTISHTWVGDLAVTLTSPGGLNYLVMADANNNTGGCGTNADNIDVCITTGTGNPLTNNAEYMCNGGNPCLQGNWTVPCGGVTDPITGAAQAPNCDLNDFNQPGQQANGTWTLTVNDICAQDIGFLETWELVFACGTQSCITCEADGGMLNQPDVQGCQGDPALDLNIIPTYSGQTPDPADYSYTYVLSQGGIIQQWIPAPGPNLSFILPGTYEICGLSYATVDEGAYLIYTGQPLANLQNDLDLGVAPFCGDLSDDCFTATIGPPIPPTQLDTMICLGDCFTAPDGTQCCNPGPCQYTLQSYLGCDSLIIMNITPIIPDQTQVTETLCLDECVIVDGVEYCPPGVFVIPFTNQQGCDSIVTLQLIPVPVVAVTAPPPTITCDQPAAVLDGSGSIGIGWTWTDPNGTIISTNPIAVVNEPGCYLLTVENMISGVVCTDTSTVCVQEDLDIPGLPNIFGPTTVCENSAELYSIAIDPFATDYVWTIPPDAAVVSGGNGTNTIIIDWSGSAGGQVCVSGANACGPGPEACIFVTVESIPVAPVINGTPIVCPNDIENYSVINDPNVTNYTWTVPPGAIITNGQGSNSITVNWGSSTGGDVCVTASNNCGDAPEVCFPVVAGSLPADPVVSGPATVCIGDVVTYTTPNDPLAVTYSWSVPSCATILSGQGTNSISVEWTNPPCAGGDICVTATNNCGASNPGCLPVSVDPNPVQPLLSGSNTTCVGDIDNYSVSPIPGVTNFTWTVTGGTIISGQGTDAIQVNWTTAGGGTVCVNSTTPCGTSPDACINVLVNDIAATPVISGPGIVCDGSVVDYTVPTDPAATGYTWSLSCGVITAGQNTNTITVDWTGCPGGGDVCLIIESVCGPTNQECISIQGGTVPADPIIAGPDESCQLATETYCVNADPNATNYIWSVTGGTITAGQGTDCADIEWTIDGIGEVCVQAENGCGLSGLVCFDVDVDGTPDAPTIDGLDLVCVGDAVVYTVSSSDPTTVDYTWSLQGACGTILSFPATDQVEVSWDDAGTCQVCATANNTCGPGAIACFDVNIIPIPTPDAGMDDGICGLSYDLNAVAAVGTGTWSGTGPGGIVFTDVNSPTSTVTVDAHGAYTFTWTDDNFGCIGSDDVVISFNPDPVIDGAITELCDMSGFFYTVSFTLSGGQSPYTVTGTVAGTMTGDTFTSDNIASGTPYSFQVFDNLGCGPLLIEGQETCDCVSDAGTMDLTLLEACEDQTVTSVAPGDAIFDPDDTFEFILHTDNGTNGSTLGTIIDQNTTGIFGFLPGMNFGETYFISYVVGNDLMPGVDLSDDCTDIAQGQPVVFYNYPQPDAGTDDFVCGLTYDLAATPDAGVDMWSVDGPGIAVFMDQLDPNSQVSVDQFGTYNFIWSEDNNGCLGADTVVIDFLDDPMLMGAVQTSCNPLTLEFTVTFDLMGGSPPYIVTGTVPGVVTGNQFVSDPMPTGTDYQFDVTDQFSCGPLVITGTETCPCLTDAGTMDNTMLEACEDELVNFAAPLDAVFDANDIFEFYLHTLPDPDSLGTVLAQNTTGTFGFVGGMNYGQIYYVSYVVGNDSGDGTIDLSHVCTDISAGQPIVFYENPIADAGVDDAVCSLFYTLSANPSIGNGQWQQVDGPGTATIIDPSMATTDVSVSDYGVYNFSWTEDNLGCISSDTVQITFNDDPVLVGQVSDSCDLINFTYTVSFEIGGGEAPYTLTSGPSGTFNGNIFTSDPIASGTSYNFEFTDVNGCGPLQVSGQVTCECATDAGTMGAALLEFCEDETAIASISIGAVLDPEDILLYVIHNGSGAALGNEVYGFNTVPEFALIPPMQPGFQYYISAIAGNDFDLDGIIDTNDPCVSVAAGTPVLFHNLPEVSFVSNATACEGGSATLTLSVDAESCVDVTYTVSDGTSGMLTCVGDGAQITIPVGTDDLTVDITSVIDNNGCNADQLAQANIQVNALPTANLEPTATICNSTDSGMPTQLNFADLVIGGDLSGTWENTDGAIITGAFPLVNFDGAVPGDYVFTYTTASALPPCDEQSFTMVVTVEDCVCPSLELSTAPPLCNNNGVVDLSLFEVTTAPGFWSISGTPTGTNPAVLTGTQFDAANADPGVYELTFTLVDTPPVGCPTFNTIDLVVSEYQTSGTAGADFELCENTPEIIQLSDLLVDADLGGTWTETSGSPSSPGAFNAFAGTFNSAGQEAATYTFAYTINPDAPCPSEITEVAVVVHPLPNVDAGSPAVLTCFETDYVLNATADQGGFYQYSWSAATGTFPGDSTQLNPLIDAPGIYTLTVTNTATGCTNSDVVEITASQETPVPFISLSPVSCFGFSDGFIVVDSVLGGQPPYMYSLNGEPFSGTGFYPNLEAATYELVVEDANGCQNEPLIIDITQPQELNVELVAIIEGENVIRLGDSVELLAIVNVPDDEIDSIAWSPPLTLSCDTCLNPTAFPLETTTFSVMVESNGCTDSDALQLIVDRNRAVYVPNGFSPNGDGTNDVFYINAGPQVERIRSFLVFSRWGESVFQYYQFLPNNPAFGWDGTYRGKVMDPAVFTWVAEIEFIDGRVEVFKGDVTLVK